MDLQDVAAVAQIAAYVLGVVTVFMGCVALIWMVGRGARRRTLLLLIIDVVALSMILGPVVLGLFQARSLADWVALFQIAGFALELIRVALAYVELRVLWPRHAERIKILPRGLRRMLRGSLQTGLVGAGFAALGFIMVALSTPYVTLDFTAGTRPVAGMYCEEVGLSTPPDPAVKQCVATRAWRLPAGGSIDSRAGAPRRNPLSLLDAVSYDIRVAGECPAAIRWTAHVNDVRAGGGTVRAGESPRLDIPVEPRIRDFRITATRIDGAPCVASFILEQPL